MFDLVMRILISKTLRSLHDTIILFMENPDLSCTDSC